MAGPLLAWFDRHKRDLPWRWTSDPYVIWVSEIMLQQTQVDRVINYYERFIEAFPTVRALADAPLDDVLRLWEGLGYYSRARNLHAAAQVIVEEHDGEFPRTLEAVRALPGIGEYTAGAVLSIAFGVCLPAVDANAIRVLARLFAIRGDVARGDARQELARIAADAVPAERPGDFNQAVMELGALLCVSGTPGCLICPLTEICAARQQGLQGEIPPVTSRPVQEVSVVAGVVADGERVLVARRPAEGQWGGLWEFPNVRIDSEKSPGDVLKECLLSEFGLEVEPGGELTSFVYGVMNRRVSLTVLSCARIGGEVVAVQCEEARWLEPRELSDLAMPSPHRAIAEMLTNRV